MYAQLILATCLIVGAAWLLPQWIARQVVMSKSTLSMICVGLLFGASLGIMWAMDASGVPMRFVNPEEEGAFLFSAVALCIPGAVMLATRVAQMKEPGA